MNEQPQLRTAAGCVIALIWSLPLLLWFWYPWPVVLRVVSASCFLWALWMPVAWYSPRWQVWLFGPEARPSRDWRPLAVSVVGTIVLGIGVLAASFYEGR